MEYRKIGKTDMSASVIGFGAEHLDFKPYAQIESTVHAVLDHGINMMDIFMPGEEIRKHLGQALKGRRDKMLIQGHIGSVDIGGQYETSRVLATCKRYFEDLLRHLGTDYIDFGMLFFIDDQKSFDTVFLGEILPYAQQLKKEGKIRAIGASAHNPVIAKKMVETGELDLLMFSINPAFDMAPSGIEVFDMLGDDFTSDRITTVDPARVELYKSCVANEVGITVMKTLGSGKLLSAEHTPFAKPLSVGQCIHYALTRPGVVSALVGYETPAHVEEAMAYLSMSEEEKDYTEACSVMQESFEGNCVYCNHCLPCPVEIDIAAVNKYLDIALLDETSVPQSIADHYASLSAHGGDCIACGSCEAKCPFSVPVIGKMQQAAKVFGK